MLRRSFALFVLGVLWTTPAASQPGAVDVEVSSSFYTKYIWNGFDRIEGRGLEAGPVVQPRVDVAVADSPLHAHVGGSFVMNDQSELHETLYGVYVHRDTSPLASAAFGYNYYDDRVTLPAGGPEADLHEIWGAVTMRSTAGTRTRIIAKYENPAAEGLGSYTLLVGEIGYHVPLVPVFSRGSFGFDLDASTAVIYTTGVEAQDVEIIEKGVSAWQVGVAGDIKTGSIKLTPSVHYQMTFKDSVNDDNPFWVGVNVAYAF